MRALNQGVQMQNRVVDAIVISPTDALRQEAVVGSAQRGLHVTEPYSIVSSTSALSIRILS